MRFQGRRDIPLNDTGRDQARRNGKALADFLGKAEGYDFICSPMQRTRETMEIIRGEMGLEPTQYAIEDRLIEAAYGELEGMTIHELKANHREIHRDRKTNRWHFCPPGGESLSMTLERVAPVLDEIAKPSIVVAHGAVGRGVRKHLLGLTEADAAWFVFPQDKVFRFVDQTETLV